MLVQKPLDQIIALSRASAKYRMGPEGLYVQDAINVPSLSYDPLTLLPRGMLMEQAATNIVTYSNDVSNASWGKSDVTVSDAGAGKVTGFNAQNITPNTNNIAHYFVKTPIIAANTDFTMQSIVKANGYDQVSMYATATASFGAVFNLTAKTAVSSNEVGGGITKSKGIDDLGGGWFRIWVIGQAPFATNPACVTRIFGNAGEQVFAGDGIKGIQHNGIQIEVGSSNTSFIPTTTAQATRSADFATISDLTKIAFNPIEGAIFAEFMIPRYAAGTTGDAGQGIVTFSDAGTTNYLAIALGPTGQASFYRKSGATTNTLSSANTCSPYVAAKVAVSYGAGQNDTICLNGGAVASSAVVTPSGLTEMRVGRFASNPGSLNGWLRNVLYYPKRKTNAEMQTLTA